MAPCTHPGMKRLCRLKAKDGLIMKRLFLPIGKKRPHYKAINKDRVLNRHGVKPESLRALLMIFLPHVYSLPFQDFFFFFQFFVPGTKVSYCFLVWPVLLRFRTWYPCWHLVCLPGFICDNFGLSLSHSLCGYLSEMKNQDGHLSALLSLGAKNGLMSRQHTLVNTAPVFFACRPNHERGLGLGGGSGGVPRELGGHENLRRFRNRRRFSWPPSSLGTPPDPPPSPRPLSWLGRQAKNTGAVFTSVCCLDIKPFFAPNDSSALKCPS